MEINDYPLAGRDYPKTHQDFLDWFSTEESCRLYLMNCRWPLGFECAHCGEKPWITGRGYLLCRQCGSEISVTAGIIFERTWTLLRTWFAAMWFITSQKNGLFRNMGSPSTETLSISLLLLTIGNRINQPKTTAINVLWVAAVVIFSSTVFVVTDKLIFN